MVRSTKVDVVVTPEGWKSLLRNADQDSLYRLCCSLTLVLLARRKTLLSRHSRAVIQQKGNTWQGSQSRRDHGQREQPRPPKLWQHRRAASSTHARLLRMRRRVVVSADAAAVDRFRAEARRAAARSASDAARLEASEQAAARARIDRDRAERDRARLENEVARLRRAVSNEPADMRREHSLFRPPEGLV